jgi:hypothetical protein
VSCTVGKDDEQLYLKNVVTCRTAPSSTDELVKITNELMYAVKRDNKNAIKYSTYEVDPQTLGGTGSQERRYQGD